MNAIFKFYPRKTTILTFCFLILICCFLPKIVHDISIQMRLSSFEYQILKLQFLKRKENVMQNCEAFGISTNQGKEDAEPNQIYQLPEFNLFICM